MLRQAGDILSIDENFSHIHRPDTRHRVEHGGLACAVSANDGDKVPVIQRQIQPVQRHFLIDRSGVEGLVYILDLKHCPCLPFSRVLW